MNCAETEARPALTVLALVLKDQVDEGVYRFVTPGELAEDGIPRRIKAAYLTDDQIIEMAATTHCGRPVSRSTFCL